MWMFSFADALNDAGLPLLLFVVGLECVRSVTVRENVLPCCFICRGMFSFNATID